MPRHSMRAALVLTLLITGPAQPVAAQQPTPEHDTVFWESIRDSSAPEEFEAYLELFPDGIFRTLAELRLTRLRVARAGLRPAEMCAGKPSSGECWQEIPGQPGCYIWNPGPEPPSSVTWSGGCKEGLAQGKGTARWTWDDESWETWETGTGEMVNGKPDGHWVLRTSTNARVYAGSFVDGKQVGTWIIREPDGTQTEVNMDR